MIRFEDYIMPAAQLEPNPLADMHNIEYIHSSFEITDNVTAEDRRYMGKGMINTILPYTMQDNYNRVRKNRTFKAAVLENEYLKATFLPELGGRLWSLFDKEAKRELLYVNKVFQPANLAIRNAWFSGGVEFNVGIKGHNPLTCDTIFSRIAETQDGQQVLQLYELERIRGTVYGINAYLPAGSRMLYLKDTVENLSENDTFTYWWSNISVPQKNDLRVIVPADDAFLCFYNEGHYLLDKISLPIYEGNDVSYPVNHPRTQDMFYIIPGEEKWETAVDGSGYGLAHISTPEMIGRKLFVWGQGAGGKNWNRFLSDGSDEYVEIQAGIARTQLEHLPMKAGETMSWTEGYGAICCAEAANDNNWSTARKNMGTAIHSLTGGNISSCIKNVVPDKFVSYSYLTEGSGFGALEEHIRGKKISRIYDFPESSISGCENEWKLLLDTGILPERDVSNPPVCYVCGELWEKHLQESLKRNGNSWYTYYQLGVVHYAAGKIDEAKTDFEKSIACTENAWSMRNLARLMIDEYSQPQTAVKYICRAVKLYTGSVNMFLDCAQILLFAKQYGMWTEIFDTMPESFKSRGRLQLYKAIAYMRLGDYISAAKIVNSDFTMDDIREGEVSLSHIWEELYSEIVRSEYPESNPEDIKRVISEKYPMPERLDFRMHE